MNGNLFLGLILGFINAFLVANISAQALIGAPCQTPDVECAGLGSICDLGTCKCADDFVQNTAQTECLPVIDVLNGTCKEEQQCQIGTPGPLSHCPSNTGRCECIPTAINRGHQCLPRTTSIGGACTFHEQCVANLGPAFCQPMSPTTSICSCTQDAVPATDGLKCLKKGRLDEECVQQDQCSLVANSICQEAKCQCNSGQGYAASPDKQQCMKLAEIIGESCEVDNSQCRNLPGSRCFTNSTSRTCECSAASQIGSPDRKMCYEFVHLLNETCNVTEQCKIPNSGCLQRGNQKECLCNSGFAQSQLSPNLCLQTATAVGNVCAEDVQCRGIGRNSSVKCIEFYSTGKSCRCPITNPPTEFSNNNCVYPRKIGERCWAHDECALGISPLSICVSDGPGGKKCICPPGTIYEHNQCFANKRVGDNCTRTIECQVRIYGSVACNSTGKCSCAAGYTARDEGRGCGLGNGSAGVNISAMILTASIGLVKMAMFW